MLSESCDVSCSCDIALGEMLCIAYAMLPHTICTVIDGVRQFTCEDGYVKDGDNCVGKITVLYIRQMI